MKPLETSLSQSSVMGIEVLVCSKPIEAASTALLEAYSAGEVSAQQVQSVLDMGKGILLADWVNCAACGAGQQVLCMKPGAEFLPLVRARLAVAPAAGTCGGFEFHGGPDGCQPGERA